MLTMSDKIQDTPTPSPPAASPSSEPQNHQDATVIEEDRDALRTAVDDLFRNLLDLIRVIYGLEVEERKDDPSDPPLPLASRISDFSAMIQKLQANLDLSLQSHIQKVLEFGGKSKSFYTVTVPLMTCLTEAREGSLWAILGRVIRLLETSTKEESAVRQKLSQLEADEGAWRKEQEDLYEELRKIEQHLEKGKPVIVTTEGSKSLLIFSSIHRHLNEMQNKISSTSQENLVYKEEEKKINQARLRMKKELEKAKQRTRNAEADLEKCKEDSKQAKLEAEEELQKCKADLERAKFEASSAMNAKSSLTAEILRLEKSSKEALRSTKMELEQAKREARKAEVVFEKCKENLKQAKLKAEKELEKCKADSERAKLVAEEELGKRSADLKAAELKAQRLVAVEDEISLIEFPTKIHPEQSLDRVRWLVSNYKRTCKELGETKLNLEQAKGELDKRSTDLKAAELEVGGTKKVISRSDFAQEVVSMQEYKRTCEELGAMKACLKMAMGEIENAISPIEIPMEIRGEESSQKVRWLAGDYKRACEELAMTKSYLEQAQRGLGTYAASLMATERGVDGSGIPLQAVHHGSASAHTQPNTAQGVNLMSYDSRAQQFGAGDYGNSELVRMPMGHLDNVRTDGDQRMPHLQPNNRRPDGRGSGSRPPGF